MSARKILLTTLIFFLFTTCKKTEDSGEAGSDIKSEIKAFYALQNQIAAEFQATLSDTITDYVAHSERLLTWIQQLPDIQEAHVYGYYDFDIKHKNGLSGNILFKKKQSSALLDTRGTGGGADGMIKLLKTTTDDKIIKNKNVLLILQYASDFYKPYSYKPDAKHFQSVIDLFEYSNIDFKVTTKVNEGLSAFLDMSNYGIIIINTHGTPTGLLSGQDIFTTQNLVAFSNDVEVANLPDNAASQLRDEELKLTSIWEYEAATKAMTIKNASYELTFSFFQSLPVTFDNSILIANYCYSGIQNGIMGDILETKGLKSFYGYGYANGRSFEVTNDLCWRSEDTIITNLIDRDSTGIAHLANGTTQLQDDLYWQEVPNSTKQRLATKYFMTGPQTLNHHIDKGYKFDKCGDTLTDSRDGQKYPTLCIGDQVWMGANLNWAGAGRCYNNNPVNCQTSGTLYTWQEATGGVSSTPTQPVQGVCPAGWHIPSNDEWVTMLDELGGAAVAGGELKSVGGWNAPNTGATNSSGFSALPGGYGTTAWGGNWTFANYGATGYWLSSSIYAPGQAYIFGMAFISAGVSTDYFSIQDAYSLRCIKD